MSRRYRAEDLLKLRASPLICRPPNLPPIEEWMGNQDTATKTRTTLKGRHDDSAPEIFSKRPNLLDASRKSSTAPEDIVLGPPRRSFASANSRLAAKGAIQEGAEEDASHKNRKSFHERFKNGEGLNEKDVDSKDNRYDATNGKRMGRYEKEDTKPRRRNEEDDGEGRFRGVAERGKWTARGGKEDTELRDEDEGARAGFRRDRAKFDQPWARGAKMGESNDDPRRDERRPQDWRRDRGAEREWDRPSRLEADPEWMESGDVEEPAQAHTAEDFQRWKERMKAGGTPAEGRSDTAIEQTRQAEDEKTSFKAANARVASQEQHDAMDKFLASFSEQKLDTENKALAKAPVKTRFAALFSPPPEGQAIKQPTPPPIAQPPPNEGPASSPQNTVLGADDQAGFQRILQMLQGRSNNSTPQNQRAQNPRASAPRLDEATRVQGAQQRTDIDTSHMQLSEDDASQRTILADRLLDTRSPPIPTHLRQESGNDNERQKLLNLLNQADTRAQQQRAQPRTAEQRQAPGAQPYTLLNHLANNYNQVGPGANGQQTRPQERREPDSFFDEPSMFTAREGDHQLRRRPTNEHGLPAFFDDPYMSSLPQPGLNGQQRSKQPSNNAQQNQVLPPGLQRPPGLDQMMPRMPPGWPSQQQGLVQTRQQGPPPGILNLPHGQRGMPAPFGAPSSSMQMPPPQQVLPRRKYTNDQGPPLNFPPGMGPPPGFMGGGGPPGFSPMGQNYGRFPPNPAEQDFARDVRLDARYAPEPRPNGLRGGGANPQIPGGYR